LQLFLIYFVLFDKSTFWTAWEYILWSVESNLEPSLTESLLTSSFFSSTAQHQEEQERTRPCRDQRSGDRKRTSKSARGKLTMPFWRQ
jgi:hypothetical protein